MINPNDYYMSRTEWEQLIDQYIFSERDRAIIKRKLLDHIKFEPLAEEFELSERHAKTIVKEAEKQLIKHINLNI